MPGKEEKGKKHKKGDKCECKREIAELKDTLQHVQADYENAMKRKDKELALAKNKARASVLVGFLQVLDSIEEALKHSSQDKGLIGLREQMLSALKQSGVSEIECSLHFNPHKMDCVVRCCEPGKKDSEVLEVFQKGYTFNGDILRPAKVSVNFAGEKREEKKKR